MNEFTEEMVDQYLERIGLQARPSLGLAGLEQLHFAHATSVPFENLDHHAGRVVQLDIGSLFEKIVIQRRGGYCHEVNKLFAALLGRLGFRTSSYASRVVYRNPDPLPPRGHRVVLALLDDKKWLCDVSYGNGPRYPILLGGESTAAGSERFRALWKEGNWHVQFRSEDDWVPLYYFNEDPVYESDFEVIHFWLCNAEASILNMAPRVCSILTATGRKVMFGTTLILSEGSTQTSRTATTPESYLEVLEKEFSLKLKMETVYPSISP